jgi:hypothetical protein
VGRYLELDPIAKAGGFNGFYGPNWYGYAEGNPLRWMDPLGLWHCVGNATCNFQQPIRDALTCFDACTARDTAVTSGTDSHPPNNPHTLGNACDIGHNSNPDLSLQQGQQCFVQCFASFSYGQQEANSPVYGGWHFHFQWTSGIGGASGFNPNYAPYGGQ